MHWRTLYDGTNELPGIALPIIGAFVTAFCMLLWAYRDSLLAGEDPSATPSRKRVLFYILSGSLLFTVGTAYSSYQIRRDGPGRLAEGRAQVVEGVVEEFVPVWNRNPERFTVGGVRFSYSDYIFGRGFNRTSGKAGPIRDGVYVRVHYTLRPCGGGCADIWKLEIAE